MARGGIAVLAVLLVAAGCGSASRHSESRAATSRPEYTLQQVEGAFASQGISLRKMIGRRHLVVLVDSQWGGPFGYQRVGDKQASGTQFLVFVRDGPHSARRANVWVAYGDEEGSTVRAALGRLARTH